MPAKRKALGRGLDALLPTSAVSAAAGETKALVELDVSSIVPNPYQPRAEIGDESLDELVESVRAQGVIQPILVRRVDRKYQIVAGERRWRAARLAALEKIPAIVVDLSEAEMLEWALLENVQREDLNAIEEARAYQTLLEQFGLSQEEIAKRVGKRRSSIANALRLLKLPEAVQRDIAAGVLTAGHGRALLAVADPEKRRRLREAIVERNLSVRQAEELANRLNKARPRGEEKGSARGDAQLASLADRLSEHLGTKVTVKPRSRTKGRIEIHYHSLDDLDRILDLLLGKSKPDLHPGDVDLQG